MAIQCGEKWQFRDKNFNATEKRSIGGAKLQKGAA